MSETIARPVPDPVPDPGADTASSAARAVARRHSTAFVLGGTAVAAIAGGLQLTGAMPGPRELLPFLAALALVAGLPHGALDPWISHRNGDWTGLRGALRWHALYIAIAAGVVVAFLVAPALALAGFLLMSVLHFSDDWNGEEGGGLPKGLRRVAAAMIVVVPAVAHPDAVAAIFAAITRTPAPAPGLALPYGVMLPTLWAVAGILGAAFMIDRRAGAELAVMVALAVALPPLGFFLAYFAGLHSPRHMLREKESIPGGRAVWGVVGYTLAALALCVGVTLWAFGGAVSGLAAGSEGEILRAVFIGLAALTAPHAILVEKDLF